MKLDLLKGRKLVLASKSPRRSDLLGRANIPFEIRTQNVEESYPADMSKIEVAEFLAIKKSNGCLSLLQDDELLLTADSTVVLNNELYEKPVDLADAFRIVKALAGSKHQVATGVCIRDKVKLVSFTEITDVYLDPMTDEEIDFYVNNYEVLDKAGSYAIQDWIGTSKINRIDGSYTNVMGLPMARVYRELLGF
ncbi:MAG: Maf family nucleotide pyrophosphatase [Bacteroidota bacterium]